MVSPEKKTVPAKGRKTPSLNKPMILGLGILCLIMSIWAVMQGFSSSQNQQPGPAVAASNGNNVKPSKALNALPESYNSKQMARFRIHPAPKVTENPQISALRDQLASLENNYQQLQNQLYQLQQRPVSRPPAPRVNSLTMTEKQRAMQSPMLIPVATPISETQNKKVAVNKTSTQNEVDTAKVQYPKSPNELMAGSSIPAVLQTKVISDVPGTVVGIVRQNVYDSLHGNNILIPKGTRLIGVYQSNVVYGQNSLQIAFTRLIRPDGSSIDLSKFPGTSPMGTSGMVEEVNNHWGSVIGSALLSSVFSIPAILASNSQYASGYGTCSNDGGKTTYPCPIGNYNNQAKNAALQSLGQTASEVGNRVAGRALALKPTVIINPGYTFSVLVTKDLVLPPYHRS